MQDPGNPLLWSGIVILLCGFLLAALPITGKTSTWTFRAPIEHPTQDLVLVSEPRALSYSTAGGAVLRATSASALPVVLFDTGTPEMYGSLRLMGQGNRAYVEFSGVTVPGLSLAVVPKGSVSLEFRPGILTLRSGFAEQTVRISELDPLLPNDATRQVHVAGPRIADSLLQDSTMTFTSPPSTLEWPVWRWLLVLGVVIAFLRPNALWRAAAHALSSPDGRRVTRGDGLVASVAFLSLFLSPPLPDDNWVLTTNRQWPYLGFFSNYYTANAAPQPQGFWWSLIEHLWLGEYWIPAFWLRVPSALLLVVAWWLLRRFVLDATIPEAARKPAHALGAFIMVTMVLAWSPTLRPEPLVVLLSVLALVFSLALWRRRRIADLQLVGATAALAFAAHQSGIILIGMFAVCLVYEFHVDRHRFDRLLSVAITVAGLTAVLLLLNSNVQVARWAASSFSTEGLHDSVLDEVQRFAGIAQPTTLALRLFASLLVYGCIVAYAASPRNRWLTDRDFVALVSMGGLLSLALTSSKWPWHLAAAAALVVTTMVMALGNALSRGRAGDRYLVLMGAGLALVLAVVLAHRYQTARLDTLAVALDALSEQWWFRVVFGPWTVLILVCFIYWRWGRRGKFRDGLVVTLTCLSALVIARAFLPNALDVVKAGQSAWPSVMSASVRGNACGILASEPMWIPTAVRPVPEAAPSLTPVVSRPVRRAERDPLGRPPAATTVREAVAPGSTGAPWFSVQPGQRIRVYYLQNNAGRSQLSVVFARQDLIGVSAQQVSRTSPAQVWGLVDLEVPDSATRMAAFWNTWNGPAAVQDPVEIVTRGPVTEEVGDGPLWTNPDSGLWGSCLRMPRIADGAFEQFSWSLDYPRAGSNAPLWQDLASISEQACRDLVDGGRFCIYKLDRYDPPAQPTSEVVRNWRDVSS